MEAGSMTREIQRLSQASVSGPIRGDWVFRRGEGLKETEGDDRAAALDR